MHSKIVTGPGSVNDVRPCLTAIINGITDGQKACPTLYFFFPRRKLRVKSNLCSVDTNKKVKILDLRQTLFFNARSKSVYYNRGPKSPL